MIYLIYYNLLHKKVKLNMYHDVYTFNQHNYTSWLNKGFFGHWAIAHWKSYRLVVTQIKSLQIIAVNSVNANTQCPKLSKQSWLNIKGINYAEYQVNNIKYSSW